MKRIKSFQALGLSLLLVGIFTGCESTDGGAGNVSGGCTTELVLRPWYYGSYYDDRT
jgi:hypothetical protein